MELRHLRYFIAVAEELNFTRAAHRLNIAQPPLTQQIKSLEAEMGVQLFDRSAYRIQLTPAGRAFMGEVTRILADVRAAVLLANRVARGAVGKVRVGFTESATFNALVTSTIRRFRSIYPDVEVTLEEHQSIELSNALREDRLDAAFVRPPLSNDQGLELRLLQNEDMVVAVPASHRLAKSKSVKLAALASETFILYPRSVRPGLADAVIAACELSGFTPDVAQYAPQLSSTINLVAASLGISIVPQSMRGMQPHAVSYIRIAGRPVQASLAIASRANEASPTVVEFLKTAGRGLPRKASLR